ncbi:hypothetical protein DPEC_G00210420 [Dallia pectoralis]|uniref:Uncharacterized protein n=1 Tax=Dallia pectoralis TaxID=75939 RepID=A0ACC2G5V9_DALPE|nr:hypothetical protein DPEC_G00210420 [Dallia pectoralis]
MRVELGGGEELEVAPRVSVQLGHGALNTEQFHASAAENSTGGKRGREGKKRETRRKVKDEDGEGGERSRGSPCRRNRRRRSVGFPRGPGRLHCQMGRGDGEERLPFIPRVL